MSQQAQLYSLRSQLQIAHSQKQKAITQYNECQIQRRSLQAIVQGHAQQDKQYKELRAALADTKFQLKKLTQDIATERTMLQLQRIKFMKSYQLKITQLKDKMEHDNQDWIKRFDLREREHQEYINQLNEKNYQQNQQQMHLYQEKTQAKIITIQNQCNQQVTNLKQTIVELNKTFKIQKQHIVKDASQKLDHQLKIVQDKAVLEMSKKQKEFQMKMSMKENERRQEVHLHQNTKKQFGNVKDTLYEQIYKLNNYKDDLQYQVQDLRVQTEEKAKRIVALNNSIKELEVKHESQIKNLVDHSKKNLQNIQSKSSGDVEQILRSQLIYVQTMQNKIKALEDKHEQQMNQYRHQLDHIKQCYQQRPSKNQDLQIIRGLKENLWKKEKEYEFLQDQMRWFKLELSNKQDMYTKIFAGGNTMSQFRPQPNNSNNQRPVTRSPAQRGEYKPRRIGRSLMMKKKTDNSMIEYGSLLQSRIRQ